MPRNRYSDIASSATVEVTAVPNRGIRSAFTDSSGGEPSTSRPLFLLFLLLKLSISVSSICVCSLFVDFAKGRDYVV